jgi:molybdenum cofactor cytidylyltransferase
MEMQTAGIILAAGASSRMGQPKALLDLHGVPLAVAQYRRLEEGGCEPVVVVLGCDYKKILPRVTVCRVAYNALWKEGRLTSVQAGLGAMKTDGYLILPVDTVGVRVETIAAILQEAERRRPLALRPTFEGHDARMAWMSRQLAEEILSLDAHGGATRLDDILLNRAERFPVSDPNVLNNINTPAEWERWRMQT